MEFRVFGPFELNRTAGGLIASDAKSKREFWERIEGSEPGLSAACGCYVFCIKAPRGTKPWYIGKAERQSFRKECFSHHKLTHYNETSVPRKGKPMLYFIAQVTEKNRFRKPTTTKRPAIAALEPILIGIALTRNRELRNVSGTRMQKELVVHGLLNSKRKGPKGAGSDLRSILGAN